MSLRLTILVVSDIDSDEGFSEVLQKVPVSGTGTKFSKKFASRPLLSFASLREMFFIATTVLHGHISSTEHQSLYGRFILFIVCVILMFLSIKYRYSSIVNYCLGDSFIDLPIIQCDTEQQLVRHLDNSIENQVHVRLVFCFKVKTSVHYD